jgi:hypothetical protein
MLYHIRLETKNAHKSDKNADIKLLAHVAKANTERFAALTEVKTSAQSGSRQCRV